MLNILALGLILAHVLEIANAQVITCPVECDDRCCTYIKECGEKCLDLNYCPNSFPPFNKDCSEECQRYLLACKDRCFTGTHCRCPGPRDLCPFPGATFSNEKCCDEDNAFRCHTFYCQAAGQPWQCKRRCPIPPRNCTEDCYCPDIKEDRCLFTGMTIKNKECCGHESNPGCSEFYCPSAGSLWQCKERCCECPNRREICHFKGAYVRNLECCKHPNSDGCSTWHCPVAGGLWQCLTRCPSSG